MMSDNGAAYALPNAVADAMTLFAVIADPATAKANLEAWAAVQGRVSADAAALDEREKAVAGREAQANVSVRKLEADRAAHERAVSEHRGNLTELQNAKSALIAQEQMHVENVASLDMRQKELDGLSAQLAQREAKLSQEAAQHRLDAAAAHDALDAREKAVAAGEAELKAKIAEWQRVTKGIAGLM